jgi:hypothetical protein
MGSNPKKTKTKRCVCGQPDAQFGDSGEALHVFSDSFPFSFHGTFFGPIAPTLLSPLGKPALPQLPFAFVKKQKPRERGF